LLIIYVPDLPSCACVCVRSRFRARTPTSILRTRRSAVQSTPHTGSPPSQRYATLHISSFAPGSSARYCDAYICLSVCPRAYLEKQTPNFTNFLCMLPVAVARSSSDGVTKYVMYFRFCGRRHVFTQWALWCVMCISKRRERSIAKTSALIPTKLCRPWSVRPRAIYSSIVVGLYISVCGV